MAAAPLQREEWLRLLRDDACASPFQSPTWMEGICLDRRYRDESMIYRFGTCSVAVLLAARSIAPGIHVASALPHGMGAGGLLSDGKLTAEMVAEILQDIAGRGYASLLVRPNPLHGEALDPCRVPGWTTRQLTSHVLDLTGGFDFVTAKRFSSKRRGHVRKAYKAGLQLRSGNDPQFVTAFYELYLKWCEDKARRRGIPAPLARISGRRREPLAKFANAAQAMGSKLSIHLACLNDTPIAGAVLLMDGRSAVYWRGASDLDVSPGVCGNDFIQDHMIRSACEAGCVHYHMGESGGVKSLEEFKESFGAKAYRYVEFYREAPLLKAWSSINGGVFRLAERTLALRKGGRASL